MQVIHNEKSILQSIFAPRASYTGRLKWSVYTLLTDVEDGCLAWNELTNVLALLPDVSADEVLANPDALPDAAALYAASFVVPLDMDEGKRLNEAKPILQKLCKPSDRQTYTIFTTLGCNARCPYCFEQGVPHSTMSEETALDTVEFIRSRYDGNRIRITWFGGEPLVNVRVIDTISRELTKSEVDFNSRMVSNGYLFDVDIIRRAKENWNLEKVQITLDGTEEVYNRTKNYVDTRRGNPFQMVLNHIDALLSAGIKVEIRLNLSLENAEDLLLLIDQLAERFADQAGLGVYCAVLNEYCENTDSDTTDKIFDWYMALTKSLEQKHLSKNCQKLPKGHAANHCIADIDTCFTILPTGRIGKCEHYYDENVVGNIWQGVTDSEGITWCKRRVSQQEEWCDACLFAPSCTKLMVCPVKCNSISLQIKKYIRVRQMHNAYEQWKEISNETI